ncbi:MAG: lysophospholipase [Gemmatales bacterium]|nr:lysophospholipase [Gemmatales bacterium]MDW8386843.1 alpha/beta fold hydrolase [Gemmatales bacterium]
MRRRETVRLNLPDGHWLEGDWSHETDPGSFAVVFVHGFRSVRGGEKSQAVEAACVRRGWTFAAFDFRGHGASSGTMLDLRGSRLLEDLEAVRSFLAERGATRLGLVGSSMGGWASAWFALRRPETVVGLALIAPGFHFLTARWEKLSPAERERWKQEGFLRIRNEWVDVDLGYGLVEEAPQFPVEKLLSDLARPTLIFQGMKDDIVPYSRVLGYFEKFAYPHMELRLYKDGDHRLTDRKEELAESACEFFQRWLTTPQAQ